MPASGCRQLIAEVLEDFQQALARVTLVQKHRQLQFNGQRQMFFEDFFLLWPRREIPVEIQPAFSDCAYAVFFQQPAQT